MSKYIIGIDEAGRGPLAGPIVAAGIIFRGSKREKQILDLVDDSKKLSLKRREDLFLPIIKNFIWSVRMYDNNFIDKYGIQRANILLFHDIVEDLGKYFGKTNDVVADYVGGGETVLKNINFFKSGESQFKEIAAASILAKVYRDRLMMDIDKNYPHYEFGLHKGYGTRRHFEAISRHGLSPIHRKSFLKNSALAYFDTTRAKI
ncbi:ribonuclease HII [Patescibacteria group bacterium]|nr:ribonuclease HII [Patescibacteria group bacterium]